MFDVQALKWYLIRQALLYWGAVAVICTSAAVLWQATR